MKRILALAVGAALIFSCAGAFAEEGGESAVSEMQKYEIFIGDEGGNLNLDKNLKRGEMLKAVVCALGFTASNEQNGHWAANYAKIAKECGITDSEPENLDEYVTYAEALKAVIRALGYDVTASALGGYPEGYMTLASGTQLGIVENAVSPDDAILRGDFLNILHRALDIHLLEQTSYGGDGKTWRVSDDATLRSKFLEVE